MKMLKDLLGDEILEKVEKKEYPGFVKPMLATLTDDYFDDPDWIFERKFDGERCIITIVNDKVTLYSRNENKLNNTYPEIENALKNENYPDMILDAELVAFEGRVTSFSKLQNRMQIKNRQQAFDSEVKVYLYVFDIIYYNKFNLDQLSLRDRKRILKKTINWKIPIKFVLHRNKTGNEYYQQACKKGWEGIIAKKASSKYVHSRSRKWLKFKCSKGQELVIGGFTDPEGERSGFGALLVGFYEEDALKYAGKVGTGYNDEFLEKWREKFDKMECDSSPFQDFDDNEDGKNHWLEPKCVGEFGFTEWTDDNKLRHPKFLGMRYDKDAQEVTKEIRK